MSGEFGNAGALPVFPGSNDYKNDNENSGNDCARKMNRKVGETRQSRMKKRGALVGPYQKDSQETI